MRFIRLLICYLCDSPTFPGQKLSFKEKLLRYEKMMMLIEKNAKGSERK